MSDIRIKLNNEWITADFDQIEAFNLYKNNNRYIQRSYNYDNGDIHFVIDRIGTELENGHNGIYLIYNDIKIPICDWNDVKVFLLGIYDMDGLMIPGNWYNARDYQKWSYFDYIYNDDEKRMYISKGTNINNEENIKVIEIPIDNLDENIIFTIIRNENRTIFYQKDNGQRIRISDNENIRQGYLGFYHRMTLPLNPIILPTIFSFHLPIPESIIIKKTTIDEIMCSTCCDNEQNIKFLPCSHTNICSECYKLWDKPRECILCRSNIESIEEYYN